MQMIQYFIRIFKKENVPVWLLAYTIMSTSQTTGLIELIPNAQSLDAMKKSAYWPGSLRGYFEKTYGPTDTPAFTEAIDAYISSLAGYSVVCYILAIKDRHNGNIMMDNKGRLIHIDYGFVFGIAPGKKFSMETAPWKLTEEMVEVRETTPYWHSIAWCI
jgi:phosphatidylinositol 4-kinase